jgi:hypothetical protein
VDRGASRTSRRAILIRSQKLSVKEMKRRKLDYFSLFTFVFGRPVKT